MSDNEMRIAELESLLSDAQTDLETQRRFAHAAQQTRERDALKIIEDIVRGVTTNEATAPTVATIREEFAAWSQRRVADARTKPAQRDALMGAVDALDDIIAGRMREVTS